MSFCGWPLIALLILAVAVMISQKNKVQELIRKAGFHPPCPQHDYTFPEAKALLISTSAATLGWTGLPTGLYLSELSAPYYEFLDAGMKVDVASIKGGKIPVDPVSYLPFGESACMERAKNNDEGLWDKLENSLKIDDLDFADYDFIFIAGGWGASYDLAQSEVLSEKITVANGAGKLIGTVCHGALGLVGAKEINGRPLVEGKRISGVTNKQLVELGVYFITTVHPETALSEEGAIFAGKGGLLDILESSVIIENNLVTGQNQNSGCAVAQEMLRLYSEI